MLWVEKILKGIELEHESHRILSNEESPQKEDESPSSSEEPRHPGEGESIQFPEGILSSPAASHLLKAAQAVKNKIGGPEVDTLVSNALRDPRQARQLLVEASKPSVDPR